MFADNVIVLVAYPVVLAYTFHNRSLPLKLTVKKRRLNDASDVIFCRC